MDKAEKYRLLRKEIIKALSDKKLPSWVLFEYADHLCDKYIDKYDPEDPGHKRWVETTVSREFIRINKRAQKTVPLDSIVINGRQDLGAQALVVPAYEPIATNEQAEKLADIIHSKIVERLQRKGKLVKRRAKDEALHTLFKFYVIKEKDAPDIIKGNILSRDVTYDRLRKLRSWVQDAYKSVAEENGLTIDELNNETKNTGYANRYSELLDISVIVGWILLGLPPDSLTADDSADVTDASPEPQNSEDSEQPSDHKISKGTLVLLSLVLLILILAVVKSFCDDSEKGENQKHQDNGGEEASNSTNRKYFGLTPPPPQKRNKSAESSTSNDTLIPQGHFESKDMKTTIQGSHNSCKAEIKKRKGLYSQVVNRVNDCLYGGNLRIEYDSDGNDISQVGWGPSIMQVPTIVSLAGSPLVDWNRTNVKQFMIGYRGFFCESDWIVPEKYLLCLVPTNNTGIFDLREGNKGQHNELKEYTVSVITKNINLCIPVKTNRTFWLTQLPQRIAVFLLPRNKNKTMHISYEIRDGLTEIEFIHHFTSIHARGGSIDTFVFDKDSRHSTLGNHGTIINTGGCLLSQAVKDKNWARPPSQDHRNCTPTCNPPHTLCWNQKCIAGCLTTSCRPGIAKCNRSTGRCETIRLGQP